MWNNSAFSSTARLCLVSLRRPLWRQLLQDHGRSVWIAFLLATLLLLNLVDLSYTLFAHGIEALNEMNPIAAAILHFGVPQTLIGFKVFMSLGGSAIIWRARKSRWTIPACWLLVLAYAILAVIWYAWVRDVNFAFETQIAAAHAGPYLGK